MNVAIPKIKEVDESAISRAIIQKAAEDWINITQTDVIVAGAGPSGLTSARYLAKAGLKTVVFERTLSFGGGIGGGGMQFHKVVVQSPADKILREIGCSLETLEDGVYVVDTAAMTAKLATGAIDAGAKVIFGVYVNDLICRDSPPRIRGVVVQWTSVKMSGLHVDPLSVEAKAVIMMTTVYGAISFIRYKTVIPSIFGIRISMMTRSKISSSTWHRAVSPSEH